MTGTVNIYFDALLTVHRSIIDQINVQIIE